jgi:thiol-disulfide isomerase/thioredoxin
MLSISLGPLALPLAPLVLLAAIAAGGAVAAGLARRAAGGARPVGAAAGDAIWHAGGAGLLAARIVHVASNLGAYAASPWSMLDVRDGGWHAGAGFAAAAAWLGWRAWRAPAMRRALAGGGVAALAIWGAGAVATGRFERPAMPAVALVALESGAPITLADAAAGRPAVVNLWASWCGPCRAEMPVLAAAQARETGVAVLFVNQGEAPATVRAYLAREGLALREVLLDAPSALGAAVGSRGLPTTLFFDAHGRRVDAHFGMLNDASLRAKLRALGAP